MLNNSRSGVRLTNPSGRADTLPRNVKLEAAMYDFREIDKVIAIESMVMRAFWTLNSMVMPGEDSFSFEGANQESVDYVNQRLEELTLPTQSSPYDFIQQIAENIIRKSNAIIWMRRERDSEETYMYMGQQRNKIRCLEVIDLSQVSIARDSGDNSVIGFHLANTGIQKLIKLRDCYLLRYQRISKDHLLGCPFVVPVLDDVLSLRRLEEMLDLSLGKATFPLYHLKVGSNERPPSTYGLQGSDNDIARAKQEFSDMAPEGVLISPYWYELAVIQPAHMADFKPYLEWYRDRIFMGLLMDGPTMGQGDTSNRNTSSTMSQGLIAKVKHIQAEIASQINRYLIRELLVEGGFNPIGEDAVYLVFNDNDNEGKMQRENHVLGQYQGNLITQREARRKLGRDPMSDEDKDNDTFLSFSAKKQQEVNAAKLAASTAAKNKPSNQHGTKSAKPRAAKRRDAFERMKNTFVATWFVNPDAAKQNLAISARSLLRELDKELAQSIVVSRDVYSRVENKVDTIVKDILTSITPNMDIRGLTILIDGYRPIVDHLINDLVDEYSEDNDATAE